MVSPRLRLPILLLAAGCAGLQTKAPGDLSAAEIHRDATWQGRVVIDGSVKVFKGATLTILPGTEVLFLRKDLDQDGLGDGTLIVEGTLRAVGTRTAPIRFRSAAADPRPGDWLELRVDFSREVHLRWCEISDSAHTLHAHFTRGVMEDCVIRGNIDGSRLGQATFAIRNCLIEENTGKGINFRNSAVEVSRNIIRRNGSGIFIFETDRESDIRHNNLYQNGDNVRLGDFFTGEVPLRDNWWGSADPAAVASTIHDRRADPGIGVVRTRPASAWVPETGPRDRAALTEAWRFAAGGFLDAPVTGEGRALYLPSWDGNLYALDRSGRLLWRAPLGEVADSSPALDGEVLYLQTWGREVLALSLEGGELLWRFTYPASPADDHRQGGLLRLGRALLVPAWNGTLYALDAKSGALLWSHAGEPPLRAAPVVDGERIYLSAGEGSLSALDPQGGLLWKRGLDAPALSSPVVTPEGPVVVSRAGTLHAFDRQGGLRWKRELSEPCFYGAPVHAEGALFLATAGGGLWKLDAASGETVWRVPLSGPSYATPLAFEGRLFVGDNGGTLQVIGAESGDRLAAFSAEGPIQSTPLLVDGRLLFGSRDARLYALDLIEAPAEARP